MPASTEKFLKGKTALVTGSTSGIGLGIAKGLAENGANIILNGIEKPEDVANTVAEIAALSGSRVIYSPTNMMKADAIHDLMELAKAEFGGVDILINNAGIQYVSPVEEFPDDKWNAIIALNLSSNFHTIKGALPYMKSQKWGRIINIASAHGLVASPYKSAYVTAKHGVVGLTKTIALEAAEFGVTVNAVCPGYTWTPLVEKQIPDTVKSRGITEEEVINDVLLKAQPTKKFVEVEQLAALCVFLCSEGAENLTGASLPVDGGWTAQ